MEFIVKKIKLFALISLLALSSTAYTQELPACSELDGRWIGSMVGSPHQGDILIVFDEGCRYEWTLASGLITKGKLDRKKTDFWYRNEAGSRGKTKFKDGWLIWNNTWTGNNYEVRVKKER